MFSRQALEKVIMSNVSTGGLMCSDQQIEVMNICAAVKYRAMRDYNCGNMVVFKQPGK